MKQITENQLRQIIKEELLREFWGNSEKESNLNLRRAFHKMSADKILGSMETDLLKLKEGSSGKYVAFYKFFTKKYDAWYKLRFDNDPYLIGRLAGGTIKDYVLHGVNPKAEDKAVVEQMFDFASEHSKETGMSWFNGDCYRGLVMPAKKFMKNVELKEFEKTKETPSWFSDPVGRWRGETSISPIEKNYYKFASQPTLSFFISFSTNRDTAKKFTAKKHAYDYWHGQAQAHGKKDVEVINPMFECAATSHAVIDPRARAKSIDKEMNEGLNEVVACPYISQSLYIKRIFIPYENLEQALSQMQGTPLKSYRAQLAEQKIDTYIEGNDLILDFRK